MQGSDINTRAESLNNPNMLHVDAGNDSVGINTGTPSAHVELDVNGSLSLRAGDVTCVAGPNEDLDIGENSFIRIVGPAAPFSIGGFTDGVDGRIIVLVNTVNQVLTITNQSVGSGVWNRIVTGAANITITNQGSCTFIYDVTIHRWRVIASIL